MDKPGENEKANKIYVGSKIKFKDLARLFEDISKLDDNKSKTGGRGLGKNEEKKRRLQEFHKFWRDAAAKLKETTAGDKETVVEDNYYPVMRLLLPSDDRRVYGLKEAKLAKYLIEALGLAPNGDDAKKLLNFRAPTNVKSDGDFASSAYFVLKSRCQDDITLTIQEVNHHLDIIAENNAKGKEGQAYVNKSITHLLVNLSALQLKWLIRIILKELKIGIKENTILDAFHQDAIDFYNCTSSIEKVCEALNDPSKRLHEVAISLFSPCRPMLGEKAKPNQIEQFMNGQPFYIETKYDGQRFQLHKSDGRYAYYSRNSKEYTDTFGADVYSTNSTLTPYIHQAFRKDVQNVILDGEMCGYNVKENVILSLPEEETDIKSNTRHHSSDIQTCFVVFDILYYNGRVLTNLPLRERIEYIHKTFEEVEGRIMYSQRRLVKTNQDVVDELNKAIDTRLEGIVCKNPESVYKPSVRTGGGWFKVKPDYMLGLNDDMDLLIVGGYYGVGRRQGLLSHFLLAVSNSDSKRDEKISKEEARKTIEDDEDELDLEGNDEPKIKSSQTPTSLPTVFYTFCKIGSGYTMKELYEFNQKLADKWVKFDKKSPPKHLQFTVEKPDVWIDPKNSFVVQVKAVEIVTSDKYKTGCTLRFPRLEKFRLDKPWFECMSLNELKELRDKNEGRLTSKHVNLDDNEFDMMDEDEPRVKKRKKASTNTRKATVGVIYRGVDASLINKLSDAFQDKEFCVIVEDDNQKKLELEKGVVELGGEISQNPGDNTFCIITSKLTHKIRNYIKRDTYDIVKSDWLDRCIKEKSFIAWRPNDMFHSMTNTKELFDKLFDKYGDSYTEDLNDESIKELFESININDLSHKSEYSQLRVKIAEIENEYFPDESFKFGLFRLCTIYLDMYERLQESEHHENAERTTSYAFDLLAVKLKWRGGLVVDHINKNTTHCVVDKEDLARVDQIKQINRKRQQKLHIVSIDWVNACLNADRLVDELPYHL